MTISAYAYVFVYPALKLHHAFCISCH